jgi:hypothetical protein
MCSQQGPWKELTGLVCTTQQGISYAEHSDSYSVEEVAKGFVSKRFSEKSTSRKKL